MTHKEHGEVSEMFKKANYIFLGCVLVAGGMITIFINNLN
jgi:hypothetical protein